MHFRAEVIIPPTDDVARDVATILAPFDENANEEISNGRGFWDFYVIGGRYAGDKMRARLGEERVKSFVEELQDRKVTVSGITFGKQSLEPASQIPMVDALWREHFPDSGLTVCPIFSHSNDQYGEHLPGDICTLAELPAGLTADRVIIGALGWDGSEMTAIHMEQEGFWNGVNHVESDWDGTVATAVGRFREKIKDSKVEYRARCEPQADWLVVSVDYHS